MGCVAGAGVARRDDPHLEVAVEDPLLVEVLEPQEGLGGVEPRLYSGEGGRAGEG